MDLPHLISIVGAGPGDPELLTVKAMNRLQRAQVVLYDALIGEDVLKMAPPDAVKMYFGKLHNDGQDPQKRQDEIHHQFLYWAQKNKQIVRLKSGDPMVYSLGAEEISFCRKHQLNFEVIPGITAAMAGASLFTTPLTQRGKNSMVLFYTGRKNNCGYPQVESVINVIQTGSPVIIYMGLSNLVDLSECLLSYGIDRNVKIQIMCRISQNGQKKYETTLSEVNEFLLNNIPETPSLIMIGKNIESL
jgi:uroporphyrin-III C-methyltransferase